MARKLKSGQSIAIIGFHGFSEWMHACHLSMIFPSGCKKIWPRITIIWGWWRWKCSQNTRLEYQSKAIMEQWTQTSKKTPASWVSVSFPGWEVFVTLLHGPFQGKWKRLWRSSWMCKVCHKFLLSIFPALTYEMQVALKRRRRWWSKSTSSIVFLALLEVILTDRIGRYIPFRFRLFRESKVLKEEPAQKEKTQPMRLLKENWNEFERLQLSQPLTFTGAFVTSKGKINLLIQSDRGYAEKTAQFIILSTYSMSRWFIESSGVFERNFAIFSLLRNWVSLEGYGRFLYIFGL